MRFTNQDSPRHRPLGGSREPLDLTVVIITFNEERHISRAISSVKEIAKDILVIDSYSTDKTIELAQAMGARVLHNPFVNHSRQFQWGLDHGDVTSGWIMRLDADELIEPDLLAELRNRLPEFSHEVVEINFNRKHVFMGRWVRHGGRYPLRLLRVWRRGHGRVEERWMDEHVVVWGGKTVTMKGGFVDANENDLSYFTNKHNRYATREAIEVLDTKYRFLVRDEHRCSGKAPRQAAFKRLVKEKIFNRLPFWIAPLAYFIFRYFIQLGFLDGRTGLIYHVLQGFWYRFLVAAKVQELELAIADCTSTDQRRGRLASLTGIKL